MQLCIQDLISAQAKRTPDAIALVACGERFTYAQMDASSNQVARFLRAKGVGPKTLVGICLKRSVELVVAMLGILKAGGAYIPLRPEGSGRASWIPATGFRSDLRGHGRRSSRELVARGHDSCSSGFGLAGNQSRERHKSRAHFEPRGPGLCDLHVGFHRQAKRRNSSSLRLSELPYLGGEVYGREARRSALVHSSISFDLTITGLYTPLLVGGRVELLPDDAGVEAMVGPCAARDRGGEDHSSAFELLSQQLRPDEVAGKVELFVIGGEHLTSESCGFGETSPTTRLINEYGPTETVVGCCVYEVREDDPCSGPVPIGRAIDNTQLYVLDPQLMRLAAGGVGELYVGGAGVASGCLHRPELTLERFVVDPFSNQAGARMYKTGDVARYREDGTLEYLGRLDDQVKIRGYRVELGEVEAVITEHPGVRRCVVLAREDQPGNKQLVGLRNCA